MSQEYGKYSFQASKHWDTNQSLQNVRWCQASIAYNFQHTEDEWRTTPEEARMVPRSIHLYNTTEK